MGLFDNLFACVCNNDKNTNLDDEMKELKQNVINLENNVRVLLNAKMYTNSELNRLEDKLQSQFALLTNKIDSVILILNNNSK